MTSTRRILSTVLASAVLAAVPATASAATPRPNSYAGAGIAASLAAVESVGLTPTLQHNPAHPRHWSPCDVSVAYDEAWFTADDERAWDELMARGWHGIAGDHAERIYPPSCTVLPWYLR